MTANPLGGGSIEAAAVSFGVEAIAIPVRDTAEIEPAVAKFSGPQKGDLIFQTDQFILLRGGLIVGR